MALGERISTARPRAVAAAPFGAVVVRSGAGGVYVAALPTEQHPSDESHPIGPCRGATRRRVTTVHTTTSVVGEFAHNHSVTTTDVVELLPERTRVLVQLTSDGPWVLAYEEALG